MKEKRICPICGDLIHGRIDKKFCSDQCRTEFNNQNNRDINNHIRRINGRLRKNRRIMEELNPTGKVKISRRKMIDRGFDFDHVTGIYRTKSGNTYYFCYEHGYLPLDDEYLALVVRDK
jgi:predicted nucleic acid-binding Zn ribbon protein